MILHGSANIVPVRGPCAGECPEHSNLCAWSSEELAFSWNPATEDASWTQGEIHINAVYYGAPFAFMVVQNGVFNADKVIVDGAFGDHCWRDVDGIKCAEAMTPNGWRIWSIERELRIKLWNRVVSGCSAVIEKECPGILALALALRE